MASWQAYLIGQVLRFRLKSKWHGEFDIAQARSTVDKARPGVPRGLSACAGSIGGVAGEWMRRTQDKAAPTLLYFHGGGYFLCSARTHRPITTNFARRGFQVFAPDYRLAPEHLFPAAVEDAVAVYRGLIASGIPASAITLAGDSAGGGLTMATLLFLRDAGDALPAAAALFSPWTDLAATGDSIRTNNHRDVMFYGDRIAAGAKIYLGEADPRTPLASPLYAALHGLPPLLIHASEYEVLLDDSTRLAEGVRTAGGFARLRTWPVVPHAWQIFSFMPEAQQSMAAAAAFLLEASVGQAALAPIR